MLFCFVKEEINLKRKNKNIITIILLELMIISLVVTIIYAKKSVNNNQGNISSMNDNDKQMPGNNEEPNQIAVIKEKHNLICRMIINVVKSNQKCQMGRIKII